MNYITRQFTNVVWLGPNDVGDVMTLQSMVFQNLVKDAKRVFRRRGQDVFVSHLKDNMPLLGVYRQGGLSGIAMLVFPDHYKNKIAFRRNLKGYPLEAFNKKSLVVVQGLMVRPNMQGQGVATELLEKTAELCAETGRRDIVAKVAVSNEKSESRFRGLGFEQFAKGFDPQKRHKVVYLVGDSFEVWQNAANPKRGSSRKHKRPTI